MQIRSDTVGPTAGRAHMRTAEAAAHMGVSQSYLEKCRLTGTGPRYAKVGKLVIYKVHDLDLWLDTHKRGSTSESCCPGSTAQSNRIESGKRRPARAD
jgi:hypothetical protein